MANEPLLSEAVLPYGDPMLWSIRSNVKWRRLVDYSRIDVLAAVPGKMSQIEGSA